MGSKQVRAVRHTEEAKRPGWRSIINGVMEIDQEASHRRVVAFLKASDKGALSLSEIEALLDQAAEVAHLADKIAAKARRDYELDKERHAVWMDGRKSSARTELEAAKAEGNLKKQISIDMILDLVRASWPEEHTAQVKRLKDFQGAVHTLEKLPKRCEDRRNSLAKMADSAMARGNHTRSGR